MKIIIEIEKEHVEENKSKHSNDFEPTLYPNKILAALIANNNGQIITC
jgi:hypothetical protein